ncbi:MAG: RluA family pseudouridine synthase [Desulfobacterota bacterium]|nr:RluA family pseudouridine synthase [Thermodesulfobacteriota bacterium]MDW8002103.1 RluA family pseudouridine synthase [Deltaproteobacteria bacterium]
MGEKFIIEADTDGLRLDVFLSQKLSLTRSKVKHMIDSGYVRIRDRKAKPSLIIKKNLVIEGEIPEGPLPALEPQNIPLHILYEDEFLMLINKPKGMVVHPSFGHKNGTLVNAIMGYLGLSVPFCSGENIRPGIVHRLDKDTTGVILVAKNFKVQERLSQMFKERKVKKVYRAIVWGSLKNERGVIEGNIGRHPKERKKMAVLKTGGKEALTEYRLLEPLGSYSYVEVYPHTGRTHQIRVHFASIGHPIVGDSVYGKKIKGLAERPLLHAFSLEFLHPYTEKLISVIAPEPEDIKEFVRIHMQKVER